MIKKGGWLEAFWKLKADKLKWVGLGDYVKENEVFPVSQINTEVRSKIPIITDIPLDCQRTQFKKNFFKLYKLQVPLAVNYNWETNSLKSFSCWHFPKEMWHVSYSCHTGVQSRGFGDNVYFPELHFMFTVTANGTTSGSHNFNSLLCLILHNHKCNPISSFRSCTFRSF